MSIKMSTVEENEKIGDSMGNPYGNGHRKRSESMSIEDQNTGRCSILRRSKDMALGQRPGNSAITDGRMDSLLGARYW